MAEIGKNCVRYDELRLFGQGQFGVLNLQLARATSVQRSLSEAVLGSFRPIRVANDVLCRDVRLFYFSAFTLVAAIQIVLYIVDPVVHFYWLDSDEYLFTALEGGIPPDRPFFYGYFLRFVTSLSNDFTSIVIVQILLYVFSALGLAVIMREYLKAPPIVALLIAVIASALPLHVIWTRYLMTETVTLFLLTAFVIACLEYLRSAKLRWLVAAEFIAVLSIGFRYAMIPPSIIVPVILPVLLWIKTTWFDNRVGGDDRTNVYSSGRRFLTHTVLAVALLFILHGSYRAYYAQEFVAWYSQSDGQFRYGKGPTYNKWYQNKRGRYSFGPSYSYANGLFLIAYLVPLVEAEDFPLGVDGAAILNATKFDLKDRNMRNWHYWASNEGLISQIIKAVERDRSILLSPNEVAQQTGYNVLRRNPWGVAKIFWATQLDFWDRRRFRLQIRHDLAVNWGAIERNVHPNFAANMREQFGFDVTSSYQQWSPLQAWVREQRRFAAYMSIAVLLVPLALVIHRRESWIYLFLIGGLLFYFEFSAVMLATGPNVRYLHPVSWLFFLVVASIFAPDWQRLRLAGAARSGES